MRFGSILVCTLLLIGGRFFVVAEGQEKKAGGVTAGSNQANAQIEIKADRFSNMTTLLLKPQIILEKPDHFMTITIKTEVGGTSADRGEDNVYVYAQIDSQASTFLDYGDHEVKFLVDDKPFDTIDLRFSEIPQETKYYIEKHNLQRRKSFSRSFFPSSLERLRKAERIELRVGPFEMAFSKQVVATLREYAGEVLAQQKILKERK